MVVGIYGSDTEPEGEVGLRCHKSLATMVYVLYILRDSVHAHGLCKHYKKLRSNEFLVHATNGSRTECSPFFYSYESYNS